MIIYAINDHVPKGVLAKNFLTNISAFNQIPSRELFPLEVVVEPGAMRWGSMFAHVRFLMTVDGRELHVRITNLFRSVLSFSLHFLVASYPR